MCAKHMSSAQMSNFSHALTLPARWVFSAY
jgi:hypothetical protein